MRLLDRLRDLRSSERGFSLIESVVSLSILMTVMGGLTTLIVSGTNAEVEMNRRFKAQTEARLALDVLRRDVHCARSSSAANPAATVTLNVTGCGLSTGSSVTWCTVANGSYRYGLWRYDSATCSGTGRKVGDYLTTQNAFTYAAPSGSTAAGTGKSATLAVTLAVNLAPTIKRKAYILQDTIALRNSTRPA